MQRRLEVGVIIGGACDCSDALNQQISAPNVTESDESTSALPRRHALAIDVR